MEVILSQDVQTIGKIGDVVKVKPGFARNYLIPNKLAYPATAANLRRIEIEKAKKVETDRQAKSSAEELAEKLSKVSCTITVEVNDLDRLYGSITEVEIVRALEQEGFTVDKRSIILEKPISELGIFDVGVRLHPEVTAKFRLWVAKK